MSKFYVPKRYDTVAADEGKWFEIRDDNGTYHGDYKLRLVDQHSQRAERDNKRLRIKYAADIKKANSYDLHKIVLCETALVDWKLPTDPADPKAKSVPFSVADALEYFGMEETRWLCMELSRLAGDITHFAPAEAADAEAAEKN